jgi:hypothetical protein
MISSRGAGLGRVDIHAKHRKRGGDLRERQEVAGCFFIAGCHAAVVLDAVDEAFDQVSPSVLPFVVASLDATDFQRRDDDFGLATTNQLEKRIGIISFVGDDSGRTMVPKQLGRSHRVVFLSRAETKFDRTAASIAS